MRRSSNERSLSMLTYSEYISPINLDDTLDLKEIVLDDSTAELVYAMAA